jgi:GT2 family glycosyltransferase
MKVEMLIPNKGSPPRVSVIIVNYNAGELLIACVKAVLASTIPVTIHVVDNASIDNSLTILQQITVTHPNVQITAHTKNLGFAAGANSVLNQITSEYLLFLNPDCFIQPNTLAEFCRIMDNYSQAGMSGALVCNTDGSEQAGCRRSIPLPWRSLIRVLHLDKLVPSYASFKSFVLTQEPLPIEPIPIEGISGAFMFVRHSALQDVGPMDESYFLHCEDLDWFMRFHEKNWIILFIPSLSVTHIKGACSQAEPMRVLWYKHRSMIRFYRKFFYRRYPRLLMWGVIFAVWTRFALLAIITYVHHGQKSR